MNIEPVGKTRLKLGYVFSGQTSIHKRIVEKVLGHPLPRAAVVHHVNEQRDDNRHVNLVICEGVSYHMLLHLRMRIMRAGGDPNTQKICWICKQLKPRTEFYRSNETCDGIVNRCCPCERAMARKYYHAKKKRPVEK